MYNKLRRFIAKSGSNALLVIAAGFAAIILLGAVLLALPWSSQTGQSIGFFDGLFTSTSAVCVTGLIVRDTATTFSIFGRVVLISLIQVGGLGFMTFAAMILRLLGRQISLRERMIIRESMNESGVGGMVALMGWVAKCAFAVEAAGACVLALRFVPQFGWLKGLGYSIFHSISAFCNAGFDLFGNYSSLTGYYNDLIVNLAVMALIIIGGLGFGLLRNLFSLRRGGYLYLQTRIVLAAYGILLLFGWGFTLLAEWNNPQSLGSLNFAEKLLASLFQSVTFRTAGFNTIDQAALKPATKLVGSFLMFCGAAPASTGGGVKVTTLALIFLSVRATVRGSGEITAFRRSLSAGLVRRALAVALIAFSVLLFDTVTISLMQPELPFMDILFECASAVGTVGVSAFGSARLNAVSRILIILTMYMGRIGPLTMALVLAHRQGGDKVKVQYPEGHIMIG